MKEISEHHLKVPITSDHQFFNTNAILYIDVLEILDDLERVPSEILHGGKRYFPLFGTGAPQNLILNSFRKLDIGGKSLFLTFDAKSLPFIIEQGKVFDFSEFYRKPKYCKETKNGYVYNFKISSSFILERYVIPYLDK